MRREALWVILMVIGVFAGYAWAGRYWIDVVDEGYFLDLSNRVLHGALPYRDFSTYYTPGVFYLFVLVFKLLGTSILPVRVLMAGLRAASALLLFSLARRVAPWWLAWLPFGVVAAVDHWPIEPEPHPSWPAMVATLLTMELVARHVGSRRLRWLALAGGAAAVAVLFKQNVGAFCAIGLASYVVLRPRERAGRLLQWMRVVFVVGVGLAVSALLLPAMDVSVALALWLPVLAALGLALRTHGVGSDSAGMAVRDGGHVGEGSSGVAVRGAGGLGGWVVIGEVVATGGPFVVVSAVWLVPLVLALGVDGTPFGLFAGLSVDQSALAIPFAPIWPALRRPLTDDPQIGPWLNALDGAFGSWNLYLPALAAWAGITALLTQRRTELLRWYVLFGTLATLAMYPRIDPLHALVSSPPILVAGTGALAVLCGGRRRSCGAWPGLWLRTAGVAGAMALVVAAVAPQILWRYATLVTAGAYVPLGIEPSASVPYGAEMGADWSGANVTRTSLGGEVEQMGEILVPYQVAVDTRGVVDFVVAGTPPGAPLFVYPAAPLLNVLADRPNPTRFDHFLPGTLTQADLELTIDELEHSQPRYVVWDHRGVVVWQTDPANRLLSDYLWRCYRQVTAFGLYLVLERVTDGC